MPVDWQSLAMIAYVSLMASVAAFIFFNRAVEVVGPWGSAKTLAALAKDCVDSSKTTCKTSTDCTNGGICPGGTLASPEKVCTGDTDCRQDNGFVCTSPENTCLPQ